MAEPAVLQPRPPSPASTGAGGLSALELEVLAGGWHRECDDLRPELPSTLPVSFESVAAYVAAFQPLLHEEARESVRDSLEQVCNQLR
jgi:hypothetical protein